MGKILITGAAGQIGSELLPALAGRFGPENVIGIDIKDTVVQTGKFEKADVKDLENLERIISGNKIDTIYHLVSLLSATSETDPHLAWEINLANLKDVLDLAVNHGLRVFWPSSIAAFGPNTPRTNTPQHTIMDPNTMYGVTKVAGELLCQYYFKKYKLDVRSLRYPGLISWKTTPGGGTTDYACAMIMAAAENVPYVCYLRPDTKLPMMYMDDAIEATMQLMSADPVGLSVRTSYNLSGFSFSPVELEAEINSHTKIAVSYSPDERQEIADSWPQSIDDSRARSDWGWFPKTSFSETVSLMLSNIRQEGYEAEV